MRMTLPFLFLALILNSCADGKQKNIRELICKAPLEAIHDGDTMRVTCNGTKHKIRFACIDAPEIGQKGGTESRDFLRNLIREHGSMVMVKITDKDKHGRDVAEVYIQTGERWDLVQLIQARAGMVWAFERHSDDCPSFSSVKTAWKIARETKKGLFSDNPVPPWEWRESANKKREH